MRKTITITILTLVSWLNGNSQPGIGWEFQISGTTNNLNSIYFITESSGCIVGDGGIILQTTDGGLNWNEQTSGTTADLMSLFLVNNNGWVVGNSGTVLKTTNSGNSWVSQNSNTSENLNSVYFVNDQTGFAVGNNGTYISTDNGGTSWTYTQLSPADFYAIAFGSLNGWILSDFYEIWLSENAGISWSLITNPLPVNFLSASMIDDNNGWIVGEQGKIQFTTNHGLNWTAQNSNVSESLLSVMAIDQNNVWAVGSGVIIQTSDGGNNWDTQSTVETPSLNSVFFINDSSGWAVGDEGNIITTTSNVLNVEPVLGTIPAEFSLIQNYPNPFNPSTTISFSIPEASLVSLKIFNSLGEEIETLVLEELIAGNYKYDWSAEGLSSGIYFYKLQTDNFYETKKMILLK